LTGPCNTARFRVRLFAALRERAGWSERSTCAHSWPAHPPPASDLWWQLELGGDGARYDGAPARQPRVAINQGLRQLGSTAARPETSWPSCPDQRRLRPWHLPGADSHHDASIHSPPWPRWHGTWSWKLELDPAARQNHPDKEAAAEAHFNRPGPAASHAARRTPRRASNWSNYPA